MTNGEMMARVLGWGETSGQLHGIEVREFGFPDLASAQAYADDCAMHGLSVVVRRSPMMSDPEWEALLQDVGIPQNEDIPSREAFRDWEADAAANLILTEDTLAKLWDVLAERAKVLDGHLCSISFPDRARDPGTPNG